MRSAVQQPPLVVHVIFRLDVGGLENGLINLINVMPTERYRHAIVCLSYATAFQQRLQKPIPVFELHKREGHDLGLYMRLWRVFRQLHPAIVHTRNLGTLEGQAIAAMAGVRARVHGEHGWDNADPFGQVRRYQRLRRGLKPLVKHYIALSGHIEDYLQRVIAVPSTRITRISNGVDDQRFRPRSGFRPAPLSGFAREDQIVIGSIGRMQTIKDQLNLVAAFRYLVTTAPDLRSKVRLALVGDGPLLDEVRGAVQDADLADAVWLPGAREDAPAILQGLDIFALPSRGEGISNTILEAMSCGLPVVATRVGGNPELVDQGRTGQLVPAQDPEALGEALLSYCRDAPLRIAHGAAGRLAVEERFSLGTMVEAYMAVYDQVLVHGGVTD